MTVEKPQLKALMDAVPVGILTLNKEGDVTYFNKWARELLGYNSFNMIGKPIFDFAPSFSKKTLEDIFKEANISGEARDKKVQLYDFKGMLVDLKISTSLIKDEKSNTIGTVSIIKDLKDVVKLEREFENIQGILNNAGVGIVATDLKGNIIFAGKKAVEIFKKPSEDLLGLNLIKNSSNPLELNEKFSELVKSGKSFEYESIVKDDGAQKSYANVFTLLRDSDSNPYCVIVVLNDVSKKKEVEEELKNSNAILKKYTKDLETIVDVTRTLTSSLDRDVIYKKMAEALNRILEVRVSCFFWYLDKGKKIRLDSVHNVENLSVSGFDLEMERSGFYSYLLDLKTPIIVSDFRGEKSVNLPLTFREFGFRSGVLAPVQRENKIFGVLAVFSKNKFEFTKEEIELIGSIGNSGAIAIENAHLYREIKDFAAILEIKVKERTSELAQSNRLKDIFIDIMGHDLLKPADIARLSAELVLDQEDDPGKKTILKNILNNTERIIDLIENASVLAKLESGEELEFNMGELGKIIEAALSDLREQALEKNIAIKNTVEGEFPALVNPLLYDVFSNLFGNAIKYSPKNSNVVVGISDEGKKWKISVADRGEGIPDEHKEEVFNRFKRLKKGGVKGSGLGLAIVKSVAEAHKGRVWVEDNVPSGSIFYVEIPKAG
jgi:PAS domain S-box-containing protein